jgi:DNA-directed RNA polymerase sigma subunit (sigma70/sigma32)
MAVSREETKRHKLLAKRRSHIRRLREEGRTLREVAELFGISAERVRQIVKAGK